MKKLLNVFEFVFFFTMFFFVFSVSVNAYIDPSVVTLGIQVIAGAVIAVGAFIGIHFRKAKKKINSKFGIDENRNKEVESDDIIEEEKVEVKPVKIEKTNPKKSNGKKTTKQKK